MNNEEVAYVALVGEPVVEVAVIVTRCGIIVNKFHEFVNYFNLEDQLTEMEPVTDSFGTRFEHGIGEMELDHAGIPLPVVQEKLRLFLSIFGSKLKIIVNECHDNATTLQYDEMKQLREPNGVWHLRVNSSSQRWSWETLKQVPQITQQCTAHRSAYYKGSHHPECALRFAYIMAMKANILRLTRTGDEA